MSRILKVACIKDDAVGRWIANTTRYMEWMQISREELCKRLRKLGDTKANKVTLCYVFRGRRKPSLQFQANVAKALGLPLSVLYSTRRQFYATHSKDKRR